MTENSKSNYLERQWKSSNSRRFARWLFTWATLRKVAFILAGIVTLTALFYAVENWRGARAWERYAEGLRNRGEPIDFREIIPPPVAAESNFAATPFWSSLRYSSTMQDHFDTNRWPDLLETALSRIKLRERDAARDPSRPLFELMDLPALAESISRIKRNIGNEEDASLPAATNTEARVEAARAVLVEMEAYRSVLEELRAAGRRPESRFPVAYDTPNPWAILLPHLAKVKSACVVLQIEAKARLALGQADQAWDNVRLILKLGESIESEPILISYLVRLACLRIAASIVWEGQVLHLWDESQLRGMQDRFSALALMEEARRAIRGERTFGNAYFDYLIEGRHQEEILYELENIGSESEMGLVLFNLAPRGWLQREKLHYNQFLDAMLPHVISPRQAPPRIDPSLVDESSNRAIAALERGSSFEQFLQHRVLAQLLLPALAKVFNKAAQVQATAELTVLACALERYYLRHDAYPDSLQSLTPEFIDQIPLDVVSVEPYRLEKLTGQRFKLYSVGWNETDDGGKDPTKGEDGDWVWRFP